MAVYLILRNKVGIHIVRWWINKLLHLLILYLVPSVAIEHFLFIVTYSPFSLCSFGAKYTGVGGGD